MARHVTFRYALDATPAQRRALARHAGAARFAWNQCLAMVKQALDARQSGQRVEVPWSRFSLINAFNAWKRSPAAGVADDGTLGLAWRGEVCQQVFEEAAVDLARGLAAFSDSRNGSRKSNRVGFPRFKRKARTKPSFRVRNNSGGIRVGEGVPRSVRLPVIGTVRVHDDTRRCRRLLRERPDGSPRAQILYATVSRGASRWYVSITVEAPDLHPGMRHSPRRDGDQGGWVGVDLGLTAFLVAAGEDGDELARVGPPRPLAASLRRLRRASRAYSRTRPGSRRRAKAARQLARLNAQIANRRRHFLHEVTTGLVKTHDRLVVEDLTVAGMIRNRHLSRAIADAGWATFAQMLGYKAVWYGTELAVAPRWFPSTRRCSACGAVGEPLDLSQRVFVCSTCGASLDRDLNAARNLAAWARHEHARAVVAVKRTETQNARGEEGSGRRTRGGETVPREAGTATRAR